MQIEVVGDSTADAILLDKRLSSSRSGIGISVVAGIAASGTHQNSRTLTYATYMIPDRVEFEKKWMAILDSYGVSSSKEADCVVGNGQYRGMSETCRVELSRNLIKQIKEHTSYGLCVSLDRNDFELSKDDLGIKIADSEFLSYVILGMLSKYCENSNVESVWYNLPKNMSRDGVSVFLKSIYQASFFHKLLYRSYHVNVYESKSNVFIQSADMLAYHVNHYLGRRIQQGVGHQRAELTELIRPHDDIRILQINQIYELLTAISPALRNGTVPRLLIG